MIKIDAVSLLDDFESEAKTHIDEIESTFLDINRSSGAGLRMGDVFRAAHSLKGTAGLLSQDKIVAVAHELEGIFSRIKDGELIVDEEIVDIVLQSVDRLRELVENLHTPEAVDTVSFLEELKGYSTKSPTGLAVRPQSVPFDLQKMPTALMIQGAIKRGHSIYYLNIGFNRGLGEYYEHPRGLIDEIMSVGMVVEVMIDRAGIEDDGTDWASQITERLRAHDTSILELLVTSILEPELLLVALELEERCVRLISKEEIATKLIAAKEDPPKVELTKEAVALPPLPVSKSELSIRLDVTKVNELMDLANEMILTRNRLQSVLKRDTVKTVAGLALILQDMNRLTGEIQEKTVQTRMQSVNVIFSKFPRMIRDTARTLRKDIGLTIYGEEITLDKYLLEALSDPITQLIKNSADHGIEAADRRVALGKPEQGTITLGAWRQDGMAIIEVTDDGAGIDEEALRRKALERAVVTPKQLETMTRRNVLALIFEPGLSTATQVTNVSGRGVGMDIVKNNIEKLGGMIEVDSEPNRGTSIRLRLPLTMSALRALIVTIDSVPIAIPETSIDRIVRIIVAVPSRRFDIIDDQLVLIQNDWQVPVVSLTDLDRRSKGMTARTSVEQMAALNGRSVNKCLIMKAGVRYFALLIDEAVQTEETLVKPLPLYLRNCHCYSSVTVLGSGQAVMVLDAEGLLQYSGIVGSLKVEVVDETEDERQDMHSVIVFGETGEDLLAVKYSQVARIERIDTTGIISDEKDSRIMIAGKAVRVIEPKDYVPVRSVDMKRQHLCLIVVRNEEEKVGFLTEKVYNQVDTHFSVGERPMSDYIVGVGTYKSKKLVLLDDTKIIRKSKEQR
ncbi:MAG: chemotaxis protein CheA [Lachnospiraceae bacterium]|jgi:two-component system chemotaxis sensor kinase CheA|nr:chemotaxis protein CheA [Lachnospiraceae bacterium]